ncbi:MFS transporter [Luteimicrobium subarcticum]|uniref:Fucose permease n=1 Tax=Luteimicrobium subarcticum TaxID=620910 RepID=A0A2M8WVK1_9MICO|nr:MFS transporter [Luteimicrobium subarcticum]PJI94948.1 fucose permease [Luteimicrobium subarcticum]
MHHDDPRRLTRATWAVLAVFFLAGFIFASWASRLPAVQSRLGLEPDQMGLLLLFTAIGSICALPLSGMVVGRLGSRRAVLFFTAVAAVGYVGVTVAYAQESVGLARAALLVAGVGIGVWDAAMNLQGAHVEQQLGRAIMPRFHASFSFGTVAGAGFGAAAAWLDLSVPVHVLVALALTIVGVVVSVTAFLPDVAPAGAPGAAAADLSADGTHRDDTRTDPASAPVPVRGAWAAWLEPRTLLIGLVVLGAALTEGAANDWAAIATVHGFDVEASTGAAALTVFLVAMTGMRLVGTALLDRWGRVTVLRLCGALALVGVVIFALVPSLPLAMVGIALWGIGAALGFPVGMSAASDEPVRAAARVSVVATIGYSAFFLGPPVIGFIAHHTGYRHALLFVAVPVALGLVVMNAVRPLRGAVGQASSDAPAPA